MGEWHGDSKNIKLGWQATRKHGMYKTPIYKSWSSMKARCINPKSSKYYLYGARGIKLCERWYKFENFYADMGDKPKGKTLDRINNNGSYCPENCRWATRSEQQLNRRVNRLLTANGKTLPAAEWIRITGIPEGTFRARMRYGWPDERIIFEPVRQW